MLYMLDTDICSYLVKGMYPQLLDNLNSHSKDKLTISSVTCAELLFGAERVNSKRIKDKIEAILQKVEVVEFDEKAAREYSNIRAVLERNGTVIGNMDMLIAACARASRAILITNNEKHFGYIPNLKIENWTK